MHSSNKLWTLRVVFTIKANLHCFFYSDASRAATALILPAKERIKFIVHFSVIGYEFLLDLWVADDEKWGDGRASFVSSA